MLQGLDAIDWGSLNHAYGAASDVPDLLRALASPLAEDRSNALSELYGNIYHQGTVYEATSYAVPFLIEMLREPTVPDKAEILGLLQSISQGTSYLEVHQHITSSPQERKTDEFRERLRAEQRWVRQAQVAVSAGVPVYFRLLADPLATHRSWAAFVLANCTDRYRDVVFALRRQLAHERDAVAKACLIWAWASICRDALGARLAEPTVSAQAKRSLRKLVQCRNEKPIVRLLAGLGLMQLLPEKEYLGFSRFFVAMLRRCPRTLTRLPWVGVEGDPLRFVYGALAHQRALVVSLFCSIAAAGEHPCCAEATFYLEEVAMSQPPARPAIATLLGKLLGSANEQVRRHAAHLLAQLGGSSRYASDNLVGALASADEEVAQYAAVALSKLGDRRAIPFLQQCFSRRHPSELILHAVKRYGKAAKEVIPQLRKLVTRKSAGNTRILAAQALARMGEESADAVPVVAEILWDKSAGGAAWALMLWGPVAQQALSQLVDLLRDRDADSFARLNAVKALGSMGLHARPALAVLERLLGDPDADLRVAVAAALWSITPRATHVVPVLEAVLEHAGDCPPRSWACTSALETLECIGSAGRSTTPLAKAHLDRPNQWTRVRAARALWRMGEPLDVFLPVLIDELRCRPVGLLAAECLAEIGPPAVAALPRLRQILNAEGGVSEGGAVDEIIDQEEAFLQAVAAAMQSIQGST